MNHINFYFRNKAPGNYSIENVFEAVIPVVSETYTAHFYYTHKPLDFSFFFRLKPDPKQLHHITGAINYLALRLPSATLVLTVHDVEYYQRRLKGLKKWIYGWLYFKLPLKRARVITAISDFTKQEIIREFKISPDKIKVIPNPVSPAFRFQPRQRKEGKIFTILQVGSSAHKNVENLIDAIEGLPVKLLLLRKPSELILKKLNEKKCLFEFRYNMDIDGVVEAYAETDILYFASTYEGFGLPIIEAMQTGRPVITSNISPLKEVAGDAGILVDPHNSKDIRKAVQLLQTNETVYEKMVSKGKMNAALYSVNEIATQYMKVYASIQGC